MFFEKSRYVMPAVAEKAAGVTAVKRLLGGVLSAYRSAQLGKGRLGGLFTVHEQRDTGFPAIGVSPLVQYLGGLRDSHAAHRHAHDLNTGQDRLP